jgi:DNA-binding PadR family transcriptional regulator
MSASRSNAKWSLVKTISQLYALDLLEALSKKPLRYTDLATFGPNERTRTKSLRGLEEKGLIQTSTMKLGKRNFVHYSITDKGKAVLQKAKEIIDLD